MAVGCWLLSLYCNELIPPNECVKGKTRVSPKFHNNQFEVGCFLLSVLTCCPVLSLVILSIRKASIVSDREQTNTVYHITLYFWVQCQHITTLIGLSIYN
ncbi:hypothetical protein BGW37DRAFT_491214 [Umbelopsis sp. PMI_123]|nr:hypothetical protein BGW37DRAFT_491214 [Umbelopsis sp. PMI_123]